MSSSIKIQNEYTPPSKTSEVAYDFDPKAFFRDQFRIKF